VTPQRHPGLGDRVHAGVLLFGIAGVICAYWIAFFLTDLTKPDFAHAAAGPALAPLVAVYMGFESAFPLADGFVAITAAIAALYLWAGDPKAVLFGLVSGGGLLFLALIDIYFNVLHGLYMPAMLAADSGMQIEAVINVGCVGVAVWSIWRLWRRTGRKVGWDEAVPPKPPGPC